MSHLNAIEHEVEKISILLFRSNAHRATVYGLQ